MTKPETPLTFLHYKTKALIVETSIASCAPPFLQLLFQLLFQLLLSCLV